MTPSKRETVYFVDSFHNIFGTTRIPAGFLCVCQRTPLPPSLPLSLSLPKYCDGKNGRSVRVVVDGVMSSVDKVLILQSDHPAHERRPLPV